MWDGELHMAPESNRVHQEFEWELETWLRIHWARPNGQRVFHRINVAAPGGWPINYRIPDLVLLTAARFAIDHNEYFDGGPDVVVEIRSPADETYEKLPFYAGIGVLEVWVIDRDTKVPELYTCRDGGYEPQRPQTDGWLVSRATGIEFRAAADCKLECRLSNQPTTATLLPQQ
jgi:Uma2 family endonuclease